MHEPEALQRLVEGGGRVGRDLRADARDLRQLRPPHRMALHGGHLGGLGRVALGEAQRRHRNSAPWHAAVDHAEDPRLLVVQRLEPQPHLVTQPQESFLKDRLVVHGDVADTPVHVVVEEQSRVGGAQHVGRQCLHDAVEHLLPSPVAEDVRAQSLLGAVAQRERRLRSKGDGVQLALHPVARDLRVQGRPQNRRRLAPHDQLAVPDEHAGAIEYPLERGGTPQRHRLPLGLLVGLGDEDGPLCEHLRLRRVESFQQPAHAGSDPRLQRRTWFADPSVQPPASPSRCRRSAPCSPRS